jgi:hypothetical protein
MNYDEGHALNEEARCTDEFQCDSCHDWVTGYAAIDPIEIDCRLLCEWCANELANLNN